MQRKAIKPKKCGFCKSEFQPFNSMQKTCARQSCALGYVRLQDAKKRVREERAFKAETRRRKEEAKSLKTLCSELQKIVNQYARLRDNLAGFGCISCTNGGIDDAGHFYHAGSKYQISRLRFNLLNLNGQCRRCNSYTGGGNAVAYMEGYIARHGQAQFEALQAAKLAADRGEEKPLTKDEVREMKKEFRAMIRDLRKHGNPVGEPNIQPESADD